MSGPSLAEFPATSLVQNLTPRRREILELLSRGLTNDEIGRILTISPATVRTSLTAIFEQLSVTNRAEAAALFASTQSSLAQVNAILDRPAIAVLPLRALDPSSQDVAAGLTSELTNLCGRWCFFPVIAATSSEHARTVGGTCRTLGQRLGARFLIDGELLRNARQYRLNVRIDDAETERCVWGERYTFPASELFEVQDAIAEAVVAAAYPVLLASATWRPGRRPVNDLTAWEIACEGLALYGQRERASNAGASERFLCALERDETLVLAHFGLGLCAYDAVLNQWGPKDAAHQRLTDCAERCVQLAPHAAEGHFLLGRHFQTQGDHQSAAQTLAVAIGCNPSFAPAHALLAQALALTGRSDEGLVRMHHAMRLSAGAYVSGLATLHLTRGEYQEALDAAEQSLATKPRYTYARAVALASAWWLGRRDRAEEHWRRLREHDPAFTAAGFLSTFGPHVKAVERIASAISALSALG